MERSATPTGSPGVPEPVVLAWLLVSLAFAQSTVVALGDGLVAGSTATESTPETVPGGWVTVLADCLEERAPRAWTVVDRAVVGETAKSALERVAKVRELEPAVVVVGVGAREIADPSADPKAFRADVAKLVGELRRGRKPAGVVIVGLVPPVVTEQAALDERTALWNAALAELAAELDGVRHADLLADWPRDPAARGALVAKPGALTDQGHARVAAAVCDAIVSSWPTKKP